jgi:hypothetical protein
LGIALSAERHHNRLMELILSGAKELTNADGGTLYLHDAANQTLQFAIVLNDTLGDRAGRHHRQADHLPASPAL